MTALLLEQFKYFRPALAFLARGVFSGLLLGTFTHHLWVKVIPLSGLTATSSDGINGSERVQTGPRVVTQRLLVPCWPCQRLVPSFRLHFCPPRLLVREMFSYIFNSAYLVFI